MAVQKLELTFSSSCSIQLECKSWMAIELGQRTHTVSEQAAITKNDSYRRD